MKIKFNPNLEHQIKPIHAVINLFEGADFGDNKFTVRLPSQRSIYSNDKIGQGNSLNISDEKLLKQLKQVQIKNSLASSNSIKERTFDIEMETGTGKTYVYLRTILELCKNYNKLKKFIILVPSIAIKEGVIKSLEMTRSHFKRLYPNLNYSYFQYDSSKLTDVSSFASSNEIKIMVMTIQSFRRDSNIIHQDSDKINGEIPIELIRKTKPIIIVDEPQTTQGTKEASKAIEQLNPLFKLRYTATFKKNQICNLIYRLDAFQAYENSLVKKIEILGIEVNNSNNTAYIRLIKTDAKNLSATVELKKISNKVTKKYKTQIYKGSDLYEVTKNTIYQNKNYIVKEINFADNFILFTNNEKISLSNQKTELSDLVTKENQIKNTIKEHLDKQKQMLKYNIKILSLFFLDRVENYRIHDKKTKTVSYGKYANLFIKHFKKIINNGNYEELKEKLYKNKDIDVIANSVHNGYFSKDKNTKGESKDDEDTYKLIMKDKEKLLSFDSNLSFIFSHSALKEGWDNPNVFQICTLNETKSINKKRQEIGRGLRISVDQNGNRVEQNRFNVLTIIANEDYKDFAESLQKEIEDDLGIKFNKFTKEYFKDYIYNGKEIGFEKSEEIFDNLVENKAIDKNGLPEDDILVKVGQKNFLPNESFDFKNYVINKIKENQKVIKIENAAKRKSLKLNTDVVFNKEFKKFWHIINTKTDYNIKIDTDKLITNVKKNIEAQKYNNQIFNISLTTSKEKIEKISPSDGFKLVSAIQTNEVIETTNFEIPDIITNICEKTLLTRKTVVEIIKKSNLVKYLKINPIKVQEILLEIIENEKLALLCDGIKYEIRNDNHKILSNEEIEEALLKNTSIFTKHLVDLSKEKINKNAFQIVACDSLVEVKFSQESNNSELTHYFIKLPNNFKIKTPIGNYNPDFGLISNQQMKYYVLETKKNIDNSQLRSSERYKIEFAKKHFEAIYVSFKNGRIEKDVIYERIENYNDIFNFDNEGKK